MGGVRPGRQREIQKQSCFCSEIKKKNKCTQFLILWLYIGDKTCNCMWVEAVKGYRLNIKDSKLELTRSPSVYCFWVHKKFQQKMKMAHIYNHFCINAENDICVCVSAR